jgi:hypothetical protein
MLFSERPYASLQQERSQERSSQEQQQPEAQQRVQQEAAQNAAQERQPQLSSQPQQQPQPSQQQPSPPQQPIPTDLGPMLPMPSDAKLVTLITSSLLALDQANATANYTVLRDVAAPEFQQTNSPEHLAEVFKNLRTRGLDLSLIVLHEPRLFRRPEINERGLLRVTGFFPMEAERILFDVIYQPVQGKWRLFGMAVDTTPAATQPSAAAPPQERSASADNPQSKAKTPTEASEGENPPAPSRKPKEKPKTTQAAGNASQNATPEVDIRDRIDNPPPKPEPVKPKKRDIWNPFGR